MSTIRIIAFDLGGVLFSEGKSSAVPALRAIGYDPAIVLPFLSGPKASALRRGELTDEQFWIQWLQYGFQDVTGSHLLCFRPQLPAGYDALAIKNAWYNGYVLDEDIAALVKELRTIVDSTGQRCVALFLLGL